jgi:hypothetical protein
MISGYGEKLYSASDLLSGFVVWGDLLMAAHDKC